MSRAREFADLAGSADAGGLTGRRLTINGAMQVWQRGLTQTSTGYGCVDRWQNTVSGTTTFSQDTASLPTGFEYALRWTTGASSSYGQSRQFLETSTVKILRGRTLTASAYVKVSGSYSGFVSWEIAYSTTSDVDAGNTWLQLTETNVVTASASDASSDYKRISCNVTIPSNAVGAYIGIVPDAAQASGEWVSATGVQLELGDTATPFEHRSFGDEYNRCLRYTYVPRNDSTSGSDGSTIATGFCQTGSIGVYFTEFPVPMRDIPTLTTTSTAGSIEQAYHNAGATSHNVSDMSYIASISGNQKACFTVGSASFSGGESAFCRYATGNIADNIIVFSAEL